MLAINKEVTQLKSNNNQKLDELSVELEQLQKESNQRIGRVKAIVKQLKNDQEQEMGKLSGKLVGVKDENQRKINELNKEINQMKSDLAEVKKINDQLIEKLAVKFKKNESKEISTLKKRVAQLEAFVAQVRSQKHLSSQAEFPDIGTNKYLAEDVSDASTIQVKKSASCEKKKPECDTGDEGCIVFSDVEDADSGQDDFNSSELLKDLFAHSPEENRATLENEHGEKQMEAKSNKSRAKPSKKPAKPKVSKSKSSSRNESVKDKKLEKSDQEGSDSEITDQTECVRPRRKTGSTQKRERYFSSDSSDVEIPKKKKAESTSKQSGKKTKSSTSRTSSGRKKDTGKQSSDAGKKKEDERNLVELLNDESVSVKQKQKALLQSESSLKCFRIKSSIDQKISYEDLSTCVSVARKILSTADMVTLLQEACVYAGSWHRVDYIKIMCDGIKGEPYVYDVVKTAFLEMLAFHGVKYTKSQCESWGMSGHGLDKKKFIIWNSTSCLQFLWQTLDGDQKNSLKEAIDEPTSRTKFGKLEDVLSDKLQLCTECCNTDQIDFIQGVDKGADSDVSSLAKSPSREADKEAVSATESPTPQDDKEATVTDSPNPQDDKEATVTDSPIPPTDEAGDGHVKTKGSIEAKTLVKANDDDKELSSSESD